MALTAGMTFKTGETVYAVVRNAAGQCWNGSAFVTQVNANWGTYDQAASETPADGSYYVVSIAGLDDGLAYVSFYWQDGDDPAVDDALIGGPTEVYIVSENEEVLHAQVGTAGAGLTDLGGMSTAMKGEVNAEVDTALTDYGSPTNAEMEARTLVAAAYATAAVCSEARLAELDAANLPADVDNLSVIGPGGVETTVTCQVSGLPVEGVECWISTQISGTNVVAGPLSSDAVGNVTFMLEDASGPYYVWRQKSGYNFANPQTLVWDAVAEAYELQA